MDRFVILSCVAAVVSCLLLRRVFSSSRLLAPGPRRKWIIGNLLDIPTKAGWFTFTEWKQQYGEIVCLQALGNTVVVLNTLDGIKELLERRSNVYSDRVVLPFVGEMMGLDQSIPLIRYGNTWRKHRKLTNKFLSAEAVKKYYSLQERFTGMYLKSLLDNPEEFNDQLRLTAGRIIMAVTYGLSVDTPDSEYITELEETFDIINHAMNPGTYLVDLLPALKYIPAWIPFASFKRKAVYGRNRVARVASRPFEYVKNEMAAGTATHSFTSELLNDILAEHGRIDSETEELIKWSAGSMYGAGGESTYATTLSFILAMVLYPDVQCKAQAELDSVLGSERLPNLHDRPSLPYIEAVIKEAKRWAVALPLGIAHSSTADDVYNGYFIPAGSLVIPNIWAISRDEKTFDSPQDFCPERFLEGDTLDPDVFVFGFGRRFCPGRYLADNSLFFLISSILSTFTISKKFDSDGCEVPLHREFTTGLVRYPKPFQCHFEPRSATRSKVIREVECVMHKEDFEN